MTFGRITEYLLKNSKRGFEMIESELIEKLAEIEHRQWVDWSNSISEQEPITPQRFMRWMRYGNK